VGKAILMTDIQILGLIYVSAGILGTAYLCVAMVSGIALNRSHGHGGKAAIMLSMGGGPAKFITKLPVSASIRPLAPSTPTPVSTAGSASG